VVSIVQYSCFSTAVSSREIDSEN